MEVEVSGDQVFPRVELVIKARLIIPARGLLGRLILVDHVDNLLMFQCVVCELRIL